MNIRSKTLKIRNLPKGNKRIGCINSKPFAFFGVALLTGICLIFISNYVLGFILIVLALYNFFFVKNEVLVEFYEEYAVFYHTSTRKDECYLLFWDEVASWRCIRNHADYDEIEICLKNRKHVTLKCVSKQKVSRYFKRYACVQKQEDMITSKTL